MSWLAGEDVTADRLNADSDKPACTLIMNATLTIADKADTDVTWTTFSENWTSPLGLSMWDPANPTRITIRKDGYYTGGFEIHYSQNANTGGKRVATLTRNNTGVPTNPNSLAYDNQPFNTQGDVTSLKGSFGWRLNNGDILRVSTWQNSLVAQNLVGNTIEGVCKFWVAWEKP
ncbi:hypothetical protein [Amycolatopsis methanolica]|uniref:Uncharacterized protein n=1 Tax=Amycolatopsis methanolica 239 TaxID=1068978 RepID=A0A076N6E3_AMYME|nr:hypothetical protein [Amycolatopsis methanolica]AIJ26356.1 hypothetical protein AMETH_6264 [Amycolatopsis methanolica 239]AIJ26415.1 hypothetical protein AMETH_6323 [Amycolatopsis methanolica 239]